MRDNKKIAALIVSGMKPKNSEGMEDEEMGGNDGLGIAAEDIITAIKGNDSEMLMEALKSFVEMCKEDY